VAGVLGAIVVVVALVVTLVVTTGDEPEQAQDDPTASSTDGSEETTEDPTDGATDESTESTEGPTDEATEEPVEPPADAVVGNGYYFELPGIGWQDAIDEARSSDLGSTLDAIIVLGTSLDLAQSNILVEALTAGGAPDLESLEDAWKRNLSGNDGAVPEDIPEITLDGERAIGVRFTDRENVNGVLIDQVVYLALHEGNQYSVALSLPSENDDVSEADFEKVLDSWTWTD
jgi:hypothetical protein